MVAFFILNLFLFGMVSKDGSRIACKVALLEGISLMRRYNILLLIIRLYWLSYSYGSLCSWKLVLVKNLRDCILLKNSENSGE